MTKQADITGYPDSSDVAEYAQQAMSWAVAEGLIKGSDGVLNPNGTATRAQGAQVLVYFMDYLQK